MTRVQVTDTIAAPVEKVWAVMSDFGGVGGTELIERCDVEGEGVGAVRTLTLRGGRGTIRERLEALDPVNHTYSYSILGDSPLPVQDYVSTVKLSADGSQNTRVDWYSQFEPKGVPEDQAKKLIEGVYAGGITRTRRKLGLES